MEKSEKLLRILQPTFQQYPLQLQQIKPFGRGITATRTIQRGEVVFTEKSLWTGDLNAAVAKFGEIDPEFSHEAIVVDAVDNILRSRLPQGGEGEWPEFEFHCAPHLQDHGDPESNWGFRTLSERHPGLTANQYFGLRNRILTNAVFDVRGQDGVGRVEWGTSVSLINHSCLPNIYFNPEVSDSFVALVDIQQGAQLFRAYHIPPDPAILEHLGIECHFEGEWEHCACQTAREQIELRQIYWMHQLGNASGNNSLRKEIWDLCSEAYEELRMIGDISWNEEGNTEDWFLRWECKIRRRHRKMQLRRFFPFSFMM